MKTASWVIVSRDTEKAVLETFDEAVAAKVNNARYRVVPILEWLQSLNRKGV